jgi:hypothetical protein
MKSLAELADEYALQFITDHTEYPIDGRAHQQLIISILDFYEEAKSLETSNTNEYKTAQERG